MKTVFALLISFSAGASADPVNQMWKCATKDASVTRNIVFATETTNGVMSVIGAEIYIPQTDGSRKEQESFGNAKGTFHTATGFNWTGVDFVHSNPVQLTLTLTVAGPTKMTGSVDHFVPSTGTGFDYKIECDLEQ